MIANSPQNSDAQVATTMQVVTRPNFTAFDSSTDCGRNIDRGFTPSPIHILLLMSEAESFSYKPDVFGVKNGF